MAIVLWGWGVDAGRIVGIVRVGRGGVTATRCVGVIRIALILVMALVLGLNVGFGGIVGLLIGG